MFQCSNVMMKQFIRHRARKNFRKVLADFYKTENFYLLCYKIENKILTGLIETQNVGYETKS